MEHITVLNSVITLELQLCCYIVTKVHQLFACQTDKKKKIKCVFFILCTCTTIIWTLHLFLYLYSYLLFFIVKISIFLE